MSDIVLCSGGRRDEHMHPAGHQAVHLRLRVLDVPRHVLGGLGRPRHPQPQQVRGRQPPVPDLLRGCDCRGG